MTERIFDLKRTPVRRSGIGLVTRPGTVAPARFGCAGRAGREYDLHVGPAGAIDLRELVTTPPAGVAAAAEGHDELFDLAVDFVLHLMAIRQTNDCIVVSERRPFDDSATIAFPHLVAIRRPSEVIWWEESGALTPLPNYIAIARPVVDVVLWELMPLTRMCAFGLDDTDVRRWRERLPALFDYRRQLRDGAADPRLTAALAERYLSFRFAVEHARLLEELLPGVADS